MLFCVDGQSTTDKSTQKPHFLVTLVPLMNLMKLHNVFANDVFFSVFMFVHHCNCNFVHEILSYNQLTFIRQHHICWLSNLLSILLLITNRLSLPSSSLKALHDELISKEPFILSLTVSGVINYHPPMTIAHTSRLRFSHWSQESNIHHLSTGGRSTAERCWKQNKHARKKI